MSVAEKIAPPDESSGAYFPHVVNNDREAIADNIRAAVARNLPILTQRMERPEPLAIVGGGPSLADDVPILKALGVPILAINGAYKHLRSLGVEPDYFLLLDSRAANVCHVDSPGKAEHILASQVHPDVFDALRDHRVTVYHAGTETAHEVLGTGVEALTAPIGMASVHAIYIAAGLGFRTLFLFGYDFSHRADERYAFDQPMNADDETLIIPLGGKKYRTTLTLARTADVFVRAVSPVIRGHGLDIRLFSEGLLSAMLEHQSKAPTAESERAKYEAIWKIGAYRNSSPGLGRVAEAFEALQMPPRAVVLDLGCGTGRAAAKFRELGLRPIGVDITGLGLEEDIPFSEMPLWDELPRADFGFCVDVLEHIPPDRVEATLASIHAACRVGCYLDIDTIHDAFGVHVGEQLHLTVQPAAWWEKRLRALWPEVERLHPDDDRQAVFICKRTDT